MIKNYFIVAFRNIKRNKIFSLINISGLAISLAAFWMISLYVANEMSYDNYHANANRIFRLAQHATWDGGRFDLAVTPAPIATAFKNEFPEVEETVGRQDGATRKHNGQGDGQPVTSEGATARLSPGDREQARGDQQCDEEPVEARGGVEQQPGSSGGQADRGQPERSHRGRRVRQRLRLRRVCLIKASM